MYVDVIRYGNCLIFSIILTMKKVLYEFIRKYTPIYKMENIAYYFRLFIADSFRNAPAEALDIYFIKYI